MISPPTVTHHANLQILSDDVLYMVSPQTHYLVIFLFPISVPAEAQPASKAGLQTAIVVREGNAPLTDEERKTFPLIHSFSELLPDTKPAKKLKR